MTILLDDKITWWQYYLIKILLDDNITLWHYFSMTILLDVTILLDDTIIHTVEGNIKIDDYSANKELENAYK